MKAWTPSNDESAEFQQAIYQMVRSCNLIYSRSWTRGVGLPTSEAISIANPYVDSKGDNPSDQEQIYLGCLWNG